MGIYSNQSGLCKTHVFLKARRTLCYGKQFIYAFLVISFILLCVLIQRYNRCIHDILTEEGKLGDGITVRKASVRQESLETKMSAKTRNIEDLKSTPTALEYTKKMNKEDDTESNDGVRKDDSSNKKTQNKNDVQNSEHKNSIQGDEKRKSMLDAVKAGDTENDEAGDMENDEAGNTENDEAGDTENDDTAANREVTKNNMHGKDVHKTTETIQTANVSDKVDQNKQIKELKSIGRIHDERRRTLEAACSAGENKYSGQNKDSQVMSRILIGQNLAYCSIQKVGSTFWKRVFKIITGKIDAKNPFEIKAGSGAGDKFDKLSDYPAHKVQSFLSNATKFLFVREPYARLFSGYADKLFSPNCAFWDSIGTYAINLVRPSPDPVSLKCGHNLTFAEFIKYVIHAEENGVKRNGHFSVEFDHCHPCQFKYDIIGKLETFKSDTLYILDKIGQTELRDSLDNNFGSGTVDDTIIDQVDWLFGLRKRYVGCMSFYDAQRRMWKKFQMRGIISKNSKYPVTEEKSELVTKEEYTKYIYDGMGDAKDKAISRKNKEEALLEAFSTVDRDDLDRLSQILQPDCQLFGYECKPDKLFKQVTQVKPWFLDIETA